MQSAENFKVDIRPDVAALRIFRNMSFTAWYALGEFVDNSISSAIKNTQQLKELNGPDYELRISINFDKDDNSLTVEDNAAGIARSEIERALRTGQPPLDTDLGLNKHGVGMKAAALWWGQSLTIETYPIGEELGWRAKIDVSAEGDIENLIDVVSIPSRDYPGTKIYVENLWQKTPVTKTVTAIRSYLPSIYRSYLNPEFTSKQFACSIIYDGKPLKFEGPKILVSPFFPDRFGPVIGADPIAWKLDVDITLSTGKTISGWVGLMTPTSSFYNSFFLHYRGKGIAGAVPTNFDDKQNSDEMKTAISKAAYRPNAIFGAPGNYPGIRYFGEFDMTDFGKTITTDSPLWSPTEEDEFVTKLKELMSKPEMNFPAMGRNYREKVKIKDEIEEKDDLEDMKREARKLQESLDRQVNHDVDIKAPDSTLSSEEITGQISDSDSFEFTLRDDDDSEEHSFQVRVIRDKSQPFVDVIEADDGGKNLIRLNENHPGLLDITMNREAKKLFMRLGAVLGAAEVMSTQAGKAKLRYKANEFLNIVGKSDID